MNKYITCIINDKYMSVGGFGHIFYDMLSAYIIANLFHIKFVYSPLISLGNNHHLGNKPGNTDDSINWDKFLKFDNNELTMNDIKDLKLNTIKINICQAFKSMDLLKLSKLINSHEDNTLFILTNNNRLYINELYYLNKSIYNNVYSNLKIKLNHLVKPKNNIITISIHIRRGDWNWQPLNYTIEFIKLWQSNFKNKQYVINIYSLGTNKQLCEIKDTIEKLDNNISFKFNIDVFETFSDIYNADIVVGGHSNFTKIITLFSKNIFIYLPYNDGIICPLGVNKTFKLYHLGNYPENFDQDNRIETDIYCKKNRQLIIEKLTGIL
jgi:hypothetical protein